MPDPDLWDRIRLGFRLDALDSPLVAEQEAWYSSRPEYIKRFVDRGSLYLHYIVEQVEKRKMPTEIALLPVIESAFNPKAYSRSKASGIWQFIPSTGKNYGLAQDWWKDNRRDIVAATDAALNYLQKLREDMGDWELALAAYNCGEGCVARAVAWNQKRGLPTDYASLTKLPPETRKYVPKLFAVKNIVLSPASYGVELESVPDEPYFTEVKAPPRIDVNLAAKLADMSEDDFTALNPAHNKAVASSGTLILPIDRADAFKANLEAYDKPLVTWTTYPARRGESLDLIARRHGITLAQIKAANGDLRLDKRGRLRSAGPVMVPMKPAQAVKVSQVVSADRTYTVRGGDTLYGIALTHKTSVEAITELNGLTAAAVLHPGLKLRIP
ncbi:MAG TPA: transglycosylase SLT domain-containing protein [Usitatibacter sp.]|nr:transglycosylase SLT domain-containing protein [Usitatibacter sp.]